MGARLSRYLNYLCEQQSMSLTEIGDRVSVDRRVLVEVERGTRDPSMSVLHQIVSAVNGDSWHALILLALDLDVPEEALQDLPRVEDAEHYDDELP